MTKTTEFTTDPLTLVSISAEALLTQQPVSLLLPDGLQLAVNIIRESELPEGAKKNPLDAVLNEHAQRLALQHHACDLAQRVADLGRLNGMHKAAWLAYQPLGDYMQALSMTRKLPGGTLGRHLGDVAIERMQAQARRIADLETKCVTLKQLHDAAADERDALRTKVYDLQRSAVNRREISDGVEAELVDECETLRTLKSMAESERDALRARLAEIDAQEPVLEVKKRGCEVGVTYGGCVMAGYGALPVGTKLYARPVPAQAAHDFDMTLDHEASQYLHDMTEPADDGEPATAVRLLFGSGHSGRGLYACSAEYPGEGAVLIAAAPEHKA